METKLWPIEHTAPSYPNAEFPLNLNLNVGEYWELNTGPPTEDFESVELSVSTAKLNWNQFIKHSLDYENQLTITISPETKDQAGFYLVSVELTDNGSDSKDGPLVETPAMSTKYTFYLQVTADSEFKGVIIDNSEEEAY